MLIFIAVLLKVSIRWVHYEGWRATMRTSMAPARCTKDSLRMWCWATLSLLILLPFAWMLISSLKTNQQLFTIPIKWWVWPLHFDNYSRALSLIPFWSQLGNTVFLSVSTVIGTVLSCSFVAYGLARVDWPGRRPLFGLLTSDDAPARNRDACTHVHYFSGTSGG